MRCTAIVGGSISSSEDLRLRYSASGWAKGESTVEIADRIRKGYKECTQGRVSQEFVELSGGVLFKDT